MQTYDTFNEHFQLFSSQDDNVLQHLNQTTAALNEQVSDHSTHTQHIGTSLQQPSSQLDDLREVRRNYTGRLPTYPKRRVTSTSVASSNQFLNSSLGSDTLFGSPNTSFLGFESTAGISGLPFYIQHKNQLTTMATGEVTPTEPIIEDGEPTEGWTKFYKYARCMLQAINAEVKLLEKHLQNPCLQNKQVQDKTGNAGR